MPKIVRLSFRVVFELVHYCVSENKLLIRFNYRPQRSWAKVMFLQASVILLTAGVSASVHAGIPPPSRHPPGTTQPLEQTPPGPDTPQSRHHPPEQTPPGTRHTPPQSTPPSEHTPPGKQTPAYGQRAAGTHPTGMHSCL